MVSIGGFQSPDEGSTPSSPTKYSTPRCSHERVEYCLYTAGKWYPLCLSCGSTFKYLAIRGRSQRGATDSTASSEGAGGGSIPPAGTKLSVFTCPHCECQLNVYVAQAE